MTRVRKEEAWFPINTRWGFYDSSTKVTTWGDSTRTNAFGSSRTMTDVITPSFAKLRGSGKVFNNPMEKIASTISLGDDGWRVNAVSGTNYGECTGNWLSQRLGAPAHFSLPGLQDVILETTTAAQANMNKPDVQGLVSAAEFAKTARMILNPLAGLRDYIYRRKVYDSQGNRKSSYGRGFAPQYRGSASFGAAARASWLEGRYGWRPFLKELEDIVNALKKEYAPRQTYRAMRSVTHTGKTSTSYAEGGFTWNFDESTTRVSTVRAGLLVEQAMRLDGGFGFTWRDIPGAALELVPYSFVAGWFLNLADFIEALIPRAGVYPLASWYVVDTETTTTRTTTSMTSQAPAWKVIRGPVSRDVQVTRRIVRTPSLPPPALTWKTESVMELLSGDARAVDLLALFINGFRGNHGNRI